MAPCAAYWALSEEHHVPKAGRGKAQTYLAKLGALSESGVAAFRLRRIARPAGAAAHGRQLRRPAERTLPGPARRDADEFIAFAVDGAKRMQRLIDDLLEYSRVATRGQPPQPTDAEAALDEALWNLTLAIEEAGATVTHDPLPTVLADPTQLMQLFQNLIGNALKFRGSEPPRRACVGARDGRCASYDGRCTIYDGRQSHIANARNGGARCRTSHIKHRTSHIKHRTSAIRLGLQRARQRHRHRAAGSSNASSVSSNGCTRRTEYPGTGDRPGGMSEDRGAPRRPDLGRVAAGAGRDVLLHRAGAM